MIDIRKGKRVKSRWLQMAAFMLAAFWSAGAFAETVVTLPVGSKDLRFAVDGGYVRASEKAPTLYRTSEAAIPPTNRLVEAFFGEQDLKHIVMGVPASQPYFQVQVLRDAEAMSFSDAEWQQVMPVIAKSMGAIDLNAAASASEAGSSKRMTEAAGLDVDVRFGDVGKPTFYGNDPKSVRFLVLIPITANVAGQATEMKLQCAGAVANVGGKLLYLYAYLQHKEGGDAGVVRAALDRFVERAQALNSGA